MQKAERQRTIEFITQFFTNDRTATVSDCVLALKGARLDPGAGLVKAIRAKVQHSSREVRPPTMTAAEAIAELAPYNTELLLKDPTARADAIRDVVTVMGPTKGTKEMLRKCLELKIPTGKQEVLAVRSQTLKIAMNASAVTGAWVDQAAANLREKGKVVTPDTVEDAKDVTMFSRFNSDLGKAATPKVLLERNMAAERLTKAQEERARRAALQAEREKKHKERAEEQTRKWEEARKIQEAQDAKNAIADALVARNIEATQAGVKVAPDGIPGAIAQRFSDKLNNEVTALTQLPPELEAGKMDNLEGRLIRVRWMEDFFLQKPKMHSGDAQLALQATFGVGLDSAVIQDVLKTVRELNGMRYITRRRTDESLAPVSPTVEAPRKPLPPETKVMVTWPGCGAGIEGTIGTLDKAMTEASDLGVNLDTVTVWRPIKVTHAVVTTVTVLAEVDEY